jgi:predicted dehydrogenase
VSFEEGAFATVGAIAMHGVRQAEVSLGERVAVIGMGLVGQLAGCLLRAAGCTAIGIDVDAETLRLAEDLGCVDRAFPRSAFSPSSTPTEATDCDAILITAATSSNDPVALAARLARDRGRVVVVGDIGLQIPRAPYYEKEIDVRLSRSYGPGRYDREYEERGLDYPMGYVRWTERRNMEAFVRLVADGQVPVSRLITQRVEIDDAPVAYDQLLGTGKSPLGVILTYPGSTDAAPERASETGVKARPEADPQRVSVIGAGSFSRRVLIPGLIDSGFTPTSIASAGGLSAKAAAERFPFDRAATAEEIARGDGAGLVAIATRHGSHAELAAKVLRTGRSVFVEKPPCLTWEELSDLRLAREEGGGVLTVGFNRRYAPMSAEIRKHLDPTGHPKEILIRVAAGRLPEDSWILDPQDGGGRLLGEGCHFVDLACWLVNALPVRIACTVRSPVGQPLVVAQGFSLTLEFPGGSTAVILYTSENAQGVAKEYIEVHSGGRSAVVDDFRRLTLCDGKHRRRSGARRQDKGHKPQFASLRGTLMSLDGKIDPDPLDTMAMTLTALESAECGTSRTPRSQA